MGFPKTIKSLLLIMSFIQISNNILAQTIKWKEITPFYAADVLSMQRHPSGKIFAGTLYDGIYVSDDDGNTWKKSYYYRTQIILQSHYSIEIDKNGVIYAESSHYGMLKSTDEGNNWNICNYPENAGRIGGFTVSDEGYIYANMEDGIFISKDGTATWMQLFDSGETPVGKIKIKDGILYATLDQCGLLISKDNGKSWTFSALPQSNYSTVLVLNENEILVAMNPYIPWFERGIYKTTNGGQSWYKISRKLSTDEITVLTLNSDNTILAGGIMGRIFKSDDKGENWSELTSCNTRCFVYQIFASGNKLMAATYGGGVFKSEDGGMNWYTSNNGFKKSLVRALMKLDDGSLVVANKAGLYHFDPNTKKYSGINNFTVGGTRIFNGDWDQLEFNGIVKLDDGCLMACTYQGLFFKSDKLHQNWSYVEIPNNPGMILSFERKNNDIFMIALSRSRGTFRSKDNGVTWDRLGNDIQGAKSIARNISNGRLYAGFGGWLFYSEDDGKNWNYFNHPFNALITGVEISSSKDIYVITGSGMQKSTDNGITWKSFPMHYLSLISELTPGHFILSTTKGYYESIDNGENWILREDDLKDINIQQMIKTGNDDFYVLTDNGVFTIDNLMYTVNIENENIPKSFLLKQNYPNPFNPETNIRYTIAKDCFVSLKVFDVLGRELVTLVNEFKPAGSYTCLFSSQNNRLPSGTYFYTLIAGNYSETRKMILIR